MNYLYELGLFLVCVSAPIMLLISRLERRRQITEKTAVIASLITAVMGIIGAAIVIILYFLGQ